MISVCIATYNGEAHIYEQIESILPQLGENDEIIISDDGSKDNTRSIIAMINDKRISTYNNENKKGVIGNIENALQKAKGDIIFLADQDDVWMPDKVAISLERLKSSDLIVSDCYVTDANLNTIHESFHKRNNSYNNKWLAFAKSPYIGCCMAFKREILDKVLPFPKNIPMHDMWIGNTAAFYYKAELIPEKLIQYRRHGNNASTASESSKTTIFEKLNHRAIIACQLLKKLV